MQVWNSILWNVHLFKYTILNGVNTDNSQHTVVVSLVSIYIHVVHTCSQNKLVGHFPYFTRYDHWKQLWFPLSSTVPFLAESIIKNGGTTRSGKKPLTKQQETITRLFDCIWHWVFPWSPSQDSAKSDILKTTFDNPYWVLIFFIPWTILDIFMSLQRIFTNRAISGFLRTIRGCFLFLFFSFSCIWCSGCSWPVRDIWGGVLLSLLSFPFIWSGGFNWLGRYCKKKK